MSPMRSALRTLAAVLGAAWAAAASAQAGGPAPAWQQKVDPWVLETATAERQTEFIVFLAEQADLAGAKAIATKEDKGRYVMERLTEVAGRTQPAVLADLAARGVEHRPYWVANMIWARAGLDTVQAMAERADVAHVYANPAVALQSPVDLRFADAAVPFAIEPNITHTGAPDVFWDAGITGEGAVLANQDTGVDWDHGALKEHYRGWDGAAADHNYNWHDSIHTGGSNCGFDTTEPCDDNGHGTHTMGTIVGDDGGSNQVGMAPGAKWISCRNMNEGIGTPTTYSECFQWFIAPTDLNDQNPDPSKAPHVISNSWACPDFEGCVDKNVLLEVVENTRAAGIAVVVSAGNSGSGCSTVSDPPAIYDPSFSVGATDNADLIATFSSRGPVTVDGSNRLKPDISAPGVSVRSSYVGGGYAVLSGTSMASPHVAGLMGLVISAASCMAGDVDGLEQFVIDSALPRTSTQTCGGVPGSEIPNNTYGWGAIRAEFPTDLCPVALGGSIGGLSGISATCRNATTGQTVGTQLAGGTEWDCEALGLGVTAGDSVSQISSGTAEAGGDPVGGAVTGMTPDRVTCRNRTTNQSVAIQLAGATSWDCEGAGLTVSDGDRIIQTVRGTAD